MNIWSDTTPSSSFEDIIYSADAGANWSSVGADLRLELLRGSGPSAVTLDPSSLRRVYAIAWTEESTALLVSNDAGRTWAWRTYPGLSASEQPTIPEPSQQPQLIVADPRRRDTVYLNAVDPQTNVLGTTFWRSDDAGRHWLKLQTPTREEGFAIVNERYDGSLLVGHPQDLAIPPYRFYVSADAGRTWRLEHCSGAWKGTCPTFVVDNAFGAGASYAFLANGIYRFRGTGPAEMRLAISDHLPFQVADVVAVGAASRPGAPVYVATADRLYLTVNAGRSWVSISVARLPQGLSR